MAWSLRYVGWQYGYPLSDEELTAEVRDTRRFLLETGGEHHLPDSYHNLSELAADSRLLIVEWIGHGPAQIDGCISFTLARCICTDPATGETISRRANVLRLLGVRNSTHRAKLALRLVLEAMLRGTIRSRYDNEDEAHVIGTVGIVMEPNEPALGFAAKQGPRVRILAPDDPAVESDPPLQLLRDYADAKHAQLKIEQGYRIVVLNRTFLLDAALLNLFGREFESSDTSEFDVYYDLTGPEGDARRLEVAVANLVSENPATFARMGLDGDSDATVWGPREAPGMRIGGIGGVAGWEDFAS